MSVSLDIVSFDSILEYEHDGETTPKESHRNGLVDFQTHFPTSLPSVPLSPHFEGLSPHFEGLSDVSLRSPENFEDPTHPHSTPEKPRVVPLVVPSEIQKHYLVVHETVRQKLDAFYESKKIPHIIFHGASGTGKLTIVQEFIHRIYQGDKQRIKTNVMTVNCSHGKGIRFIRDELKFFAKTNIPTNSGVLFKTILLLNAHHLTIDAQSALRRCIELFSYNTRFFIVLENKNKLLNPILSRFCEIYIPEYTDSDHRIHNLHQHTLAQTYDFTEQKKEIREYLDSVLSDFPTSLLSLQRTENFENTSSRFTYIVEDLYRRGISSLDIMDWVDAHREWWTAKQHVNTNMCFHRIKTEFRCEKMLMFYMLDFIFCSAFELPIA